MDTRTLLIIGGLCAIVFFSAAFVAIVRASQRAMERDLRRMIWPLVDAVLELRDERDQDGELFKGDS